VCPELYTQILKGSMASSNVTVRKHATFCFVAVYNILGKEKFSA
jgi:hypothetical protein